MPKTFWWNILFLIAHASALFWIQYVLVYEELSKDFIFTPIAIETLGSWGQEGHSLIKEIGRKIRDITGEKRSTFYLFQRISIAVQIGNAASVMGTVGSKSKLEEIFYL